MLFAPHHISLLTGNADANAQFYLQVMGLRLIKNSVNQEAVHMRHLYYGDNVGTPGSVITFFGLDHLGHRKDANHGLIGIRLSIPNNTTAFWQHRLETAGYQTTVDAHGLHVVDPDQVALTLIETSRQLTSAQAVPNDVPADHQVSGLLGTTLAYVDYAETIAFYHQWLGLNDFNHELPLPTTNAAIHFISAPDASARSRMGRGSVDHIALQVPDEKTLFKYYKRAQNLGLDIELYRDRGWFKSIYVRDPSDNRIELATVQPGFALEESVTTMGNQFSLPPLFADQTEPIATWFNTRGVHFDEAKRFGGLSKTIS